jgi:hypothetical protein
MANARRRIVFGGSLALFGAALFVTASAYVIDHGNAKWLAAAVGGFAFPLAPVGWHLIGERRRRARVAAAKTPPKTTLTGFDRFWMRFVVVALVVLGPMFATSRFGVFGSVWRHALWFWPEPPAGPRDFKAVDHLLMRVPGDAELVAVVHVPEKAGKDAGSMVFAWGAQQAMLAADPDVTEDEKPLSERIAELNADRAKVPWLPFDKLSEVATADKSIVVASDLWRAKVDPAGAGPSEELMAEMRRAPQDAVFVAAFTPRTKATAADLDPQMIRHGVMWAVSSDQKLVLGGRVEATDAVAATKLVDDIYAVLHGTTKDIPASCRAQVDKLLEHFEIEHTGAVITAHLEVAGDQVFSLMFCAAK